MKEKQSEAVRDINRSAVFKEPKIELADGRGTKATSLMVVPDSILYFDSHAVELQRVPWSEVDAIRFVSRKRGSLDGLGFGFLAGAACGAILLIVYRNDSQHHTSTEDAWATIIGSGIVALGAVVGMFVGAVVGHRNIYRFEQVNDNRDQSP
jgi:hypothetical protein